MKISASIYSDKGRTLQEVVSELEQNEIDFFHIDCNDNLSVFEDIDAIRKLSKKPIDLHIISSETDKYIPYLKEREIDFVTFQYEQLPKDFQFPKDVSSKFGLAITSDTPIDVYEKHKDDCSFILFMATTPGQSGGKFNKENFKKIRAFQKKYPTAKIHVDGGVNAEVSFILRNMGVYSSVSGSYLFTDGGVGKAVMSLKASDVDSHFQIKDFMIEKEEMPLVSETEQNFKNIVISIDQHKMGFTILTDNNNKMKGIVSNADIRKALIKKFDDLNTINVNDLINPSPVVINENNTVREMLRLIKSKNFPIMYVPVVNDSHEATGVVTFMNLIKGEL